MSPGCKSHSMSNLVQGDVCFPSRRNSCKTELKTFFSAKSLNDLHISVKNSANFHHQQDYNHENPYKNDQVSRLLDDLGDQENAAGL